MGGSKENQCVQRGKINLAVAVGISGYVGEAHKKARREAGLVEGAGVWENQAFGTGRLNSLSSAVTLPWMSAEGSRGLRPAWRTLPVGSMMATKGMPWMP